MRYLLWILLSFSLLACNSGTVQGPKLENIQDYTQVKIKGSNKSYAILKANNDAIIADGIIENGVQNGTWITYYDGNDNAINTVSNLVNGKLNGPYLEFNNRGQIEKRMTYVNDQLHGPYSEYKFGRITKSYMYKNGQLDGVAKEYNNRGILLKETGYKNGKLHGKIVQFDEDGDKLLEYEYKDGEKISGGIVK